MSNKPTRENRKAAVTLNRLYEIIREANHTQSTLDESIASELWKLVSKCTQNLMTFEIELCNVDAVQGDPEDSVRWIKASSPELVAGWLESEMDFRLYTGIIRPLGEYSRDYTDEDGVDLFLFADIGGYAACCLSGDPSAVISEWRKYAESIPTPEGDEKEVEQTDRSEEVVQGIGHAVSAKHTVSGGYPFTTFENCLPDNDCDVRLIFPNNVIVEIQIRPSNGDGENYLGSLDIILPDNQSVGMYKDIDLVPAEATHPNLPNERFARQIVTEIPQ